MLRLLLQHDVPGLRSADHQGRPPLAHLLEVAATDLAMNAVSPGAGWRCQPCVWELGDGLPVQSTSWAAHSHGRRRQGCWARGCGA